MGAVGNDKLADFAPSRLEAEDRQRCLARQKEKDQHGQSHDRRAQAENGQLAQADPLAVRTPAQGQDEAFGQGNLEREIV